MDIKRSVQIFVRSLEKCINTAFLAVIIFVLILGVYITMDNKRIVSDASAEVYQWYKPTADSTLSFEELVKINGDVFGWLTIDDTQIDYPVVQGPNNDKYINTSVTGEFSLSGALFLDSRNTDDLSDTLSIIYGHNMTGDVMFGGLDKYSDRTYFNEHRSGTFYCRGEYYKVEIFAYFSADGHDTEIYSPKLKPEKLEEWLERVRSISVNKTGELPDEGPILLLSTCSTETTNGRDLLAATIRPGGTAPVKKTEHVTAPGRLRAPLDERSLWIYLGPAFLILLLLTLLYFLLKRRKKNERE